jgi:ketopantoate reductase
MLQDIQLERATEIESLNGFIVKRAKQLNIKASTNQMVTELVRARENAGNFWKNSD